MHKKIKRSVGVNGGPSSTLRYFATGSLQRVDGNLHDVSQSFV